MLVSTVLSSVTYGIVYVHAARRKNNRFSAEEVQEKFIGFMEDASPLYIFGGDLDFLIDCPTQLEIIKKLGPNAHILCTEAKDADHIELYHQLAKSEIKIRKYSADVEYDGLRGQIRTDRSGSTTGLFINKKLGTKEMREYEILDVLNGFMTKELRSSFDEKYEKGRHPTISLILFDLGGVYFDGDFFSDFLDKVNKELSQNIQAKWSQKMMLDEALNKGDATIVDWVEKQLRREPKGLSTREREFVKSTWTSIWKPNPEMKKLVKGLIANNYKVGVVSNLDQLNGENYFSKGYFRAFSEGFLFLSYKMKLVKPETEFFQYVLDETGLKPYQILIIDDHNENIMKARNMGFYTITFSLNNDSSPQELRTELGTTYNILLDDI